MIDLPLLLTQLLVILAGARLAGRAVQLLGQPLVIGEMLAGLALGPSLFGVLAPSALAWLFPTDRMIPLATLSQLGVILFMFVVGLRLDLGVMRGRVGSAVVISHASIVIPFVLGAVLGTWIYPELAGHGVARLPFVLFTGAAMSVTAFPVLARILAERGLVRTRLGSIAIACAAVDDVTAWCLLAGVVAVARAGNAIERFGLTLGGACLFTVLAITIGRTALRHWLDRREAAGYRDVTADVVGVVSLLAFAFALVTELLGVHPLFGAFLAGTILPRERGFAQAIADRVESVVGTVLLPVFFVLTGLRTEVGLVSSAGLWGVFVIVLLVAVAGKLGGSAVAARVTGLAWPEAIAIGVLMNTRGLMELVILNVGLEIGVISPALFAMMVLMALATTVATSPILSLVLRAQPELAPAVGNGEAIRRA
ncbi:MAG TPA: cation:proton antiporter [Vicinamibacterales bacterium]|jgi:Kef-type K+ transport system membrane component KefB|nr:cation:proton antiporter [Vicinamibacterales bacterium]